MGQPETVVDTIVTEHVEPGTVIMEPTITETVVADTIVTEHVEPVYETIETYAAPQQVIVQPETVADIIVTEHVEPGTVIMEPTITETVVADTIVTEHVEPVYETIET